MTLEKTNSTLEQLREQADAEVKAEIAEMKRKATNPLMEQAAQVMAPTTVSTPDPVPEPFSDSGIIYPTKIHDGKKIQIRHLTDKLDVTTGVYGHKKSSSYFYFNSDGSENPEKLRRKDFEVLFVHESLINVPSDGPKISEAVADLVEPTPEAKKQLVKFGISPEDDETPETDPPAELGKSKIDIGLEQRIVEQAKVIQELRKQIASLTMPEELEIDQVITFLNGDRIDIINIRIFDFAKNLECYGAEISYKFTDSNGKIEVDSISVSGFKSKFFE